MVEVSILQLKLQYFAMKKVYSMSLLHLTKSLLKAKETPKRFYGDAISTTVYILNRCPTKKIRNKTPYEAWIGLKSNVNHLRVFGPICFGHVPD